MKRRFIPCLHFIILLSIKDPLLPPLTTPYVENGELRVKSYLISEFRVLISE